ncbi:Rad1-domain-containing protein [Gloeopeniophorella convolvens]|nr:Rad1-domain-containing protein [Gloeopeniophorella convolvens]
MPESDHGEERTPTVLAVSAHDLRHFSNLLKGVNFMDIGVMTITNGGLTVFVEESSLVSAAAYIPAQVFDEFTYHPPARAHSASPTPPDGSQAEEATVLEFPLRVFIDSLSIFSTGAASSATEGRAQTRRWVREEDDTPRGRIESYFAAATGKTVGMRLSYAGAGHPLSLLIAEGTSDPDAKFEVTTYASDTPPDMSFEIEQTVLQLILKSSWLRDALSELDPSCEKLTLIGNPPSQASPSRGPRATPAAPIFRIQAEGTFGSAEMDYPNDREVLETVHCTEPVSFSYRVAHIARAQRALQGSTKTSLRIGSDGTMNMQFLVSSPLARGGTNEAFISFRFLPLDEVD